MIVSRFEHLTPLAAEIARTASLVLIMLYCCSVLTRAGHVTASDPIACCGSGLGTLFAFLSFCPEKSVVAREVSYCAYLRISCYVHRSFVWLLTTVECSFPSC